MIDWHTLTQAALLGTRRSADQPQAAHDLLVAVGTHAFQQQVGQLPAILPPTTAVAPSPPNQFQPCNPRAAQRLGGMLNGSQRILLPEFLTQLHAAKQRVPDALLPALLDYGARTSHIRNKILPVLDERGRWLASQNPAWIFASPALANWNILLDALRSGSPTDQLALLQQLRHTDPDQVRDLISAVWKSDNGHTRYTRIKQFQTNLSLHDEPFLEQALDDRSHLVRREATNLLGQLPTSQYMQRMQTYAPLFMSWSHKRPAPLNIQFPPLTPAMIRDGIKDTGLKDLARLREQQLTHLVSSTSLDYWTDAWQVSAETILNAIPATFWSRTLLNGFIAATERQKRQDWALTIMRHDHYGVRSAKLFALLNEANCATLIAEISAETPTWQPLSRSNPLFAMLRRTTIQWSPALSEYWLQEIAETLINDTETKINTMQRSTYSRFMRYCAPSLADTAVDLLWPVIGTSPNWTIVIKEMLNMLAFRRDMRAELAVGTQTNV